MAEQKEQQEKSIQDQLFERTSEPKRQKVDLDGIEVELKQPDVHERYQISGETYNANDGEFNITDFALRCVICNTYYPGTNKRVFNDKAYNKLKNVVADWVDDLVGVMIDLVGETTSDMEKK